MTLRAIDLFAGSGSGRRPVSRGGLSYTPEYRAWQMMRQRCHNPENAAYPRYGGRGIRVCEQWLHSLETFLGDMGPRPSPKHEIDRIDNDRGYEPGNCRWATRSENDRNRRTTVWVLFEGERRRLADLCDEFGIAPDTVQWRMRNGMSTTDAFRVPVRRKRSRRQGDTP